MRTWSMAAALLLAALLGATWPLTTAALAGPNDPWTIDPGRSRVEFSVSQTGKIVSGRVRSWNGTIVLDPSNLAAARIDIRLDMKSATANSRDIDGLMLGKDFLDVASAPEARFTAESVAAKGGDRYEARGKFTLRGTTRDVVLPFTLQIRDDGAASSTLARGKLEVRRLDYGVGRNEWAGTGHVADEVAIELTVVASRPR
jgi:polyisoprenoid-binding protein YceI